MTHSGLLSLSELVVELLAHFEVGEGGGHCGGLLDLPELEAELMAPPGFSSYVCDTLWKLFIGWRNRYK